MGQAEILRIFERYPNRWFNVRQLAERLPHTERSAITRALKRLRKSKFVTQKVKFEHVRNPKNNSRYRVSYHKLLPYAD